MRLRIVGVSSSGKSRLAETLARELRMPRLELDAVFWQEGWTYRDLDEAQSLVRRFAAAHPEGWVVDGNWTSRLDGLLDPGTRGGADVVVWIDHPRWIVLGRVVRRTLRRGIRREALWHGNRERPSTWLRLDPGKNIVMWAWTQHPVFRERMLSRMSAGEPIVRLRGQREVDAWLASVRRNGFSLAG